jgi:Small integral membrane protein (DUF2273)
MVSSRIVGLAVGLILGIIWMWLGFVPALIVAALGIVGWVVGSALGNLSTGKVDLNELWSDLRGRRGAA